MNRVSSTVTSGELKIINTNVRGLGNKEDSVKKFLSRRKKKADVVCIVEHKISLNNKLLDVFRSFAKYRVGASYCRQSAGPGGGVALLVHEWLTGVQDAKNEFKHEFEKASLIGVDIAAIRLEVRPKQLQTGMFVFGIYRRPSKHSPLSQFVSLICDLIQKVHENHNSTAVFVGDFNINNNKEGQQTRSNKVHEQILRFTNMRYTMTHKKPSHTQGSALINFLVPINMRYSQKTLSEAFQNPAPDQSKRPNPKPPDHSPIQIIVALEISEDTHLPDYNLQQRDQANLNTPDTNAPSTSTAQFVPRTWREEDGVIIISDDEEPYGSQPGVSFSSPGNRNEIQSLSYQSQVLPIGQGITIPRVKIEGESKNSRVIGSQTARGTPQTGILNATYPSTIRSSESAAQSVQRSVISNSTPTIPNQTSSFQSSQKSSRSQSVLENIGFGSSSSSHQPRVTNVSPERDDQGSVRISEFINPSNPSQAFGTSAPLQQVTTERTYREVQTIRTEPSSRPTPYPQVEGTSFKYRDLADKLQRLNKLKHLKERELQLIAELSEIEEKESRILEEMNNV